MGFFPKSQLKKLQPGIDLLSGAISWESLFSEALNKLFKMDERNKEFIKDEEKKLSDLKPSPGDITLLQTRDLNIMAIKTEDYLKGDFSNTVVVANEPLPSKPEDEPVIRRHYSRPYLPDYEQGFYDRYILYDTRDREIIEVTERDFLKYRDLRYKRSTVVSWYILGEADDQQIGQYIYPGVRNNNIDVLAQAEEVTPGVTEFFKNYRGYTEHLLGDISEYDGAIEVIEPLEDPEPVLTDNEQDEFEDLTPTEQDIVFTDGPDMDLPTVEELLDTFGQAEEELLKADELLSSSIDEQDAITAEAEADFEDQQNRLNDLETEQERTKRLNDIQMIVEVDQMSLTMDINKWSSKAKRKSKRKRLDQQRDEKKLIKIAEEVFNGSKHPEMYTGEEFVIVVNRGQLKNRVQLVLNGNNIKARWSRNAYQRNENPVWYDSKYTCKPYVYTVSGGHARLYSDGTSNADNTETVDYSSITLTDQQKEAALSVLAPRERNQMAERRELVINFMKDEVRGSEQKNRPFKLNFARQAVHNRYNMWKAENGGHTQFSDRNRGKGSGDRGTENTFSEVVDRSRTPSRNGGPSKLKSLRDKRTNEIQSDKFKGSRQTELGTPRKKKPYSDGRKLPDRLPNPGKINSATKIGTGRKPGGTALTDPSQGGY